MCALATVRKQEKNIDEASDGKLPFLLKEVIFLKTNKTKVVVKESSFPRMRGLLSEPKHAKLVMVLW